MPVKKNEASVQAPPQMARPEPLKILLEWEAAVRPFKKRSREYFSTMGAIGLLLIVILLLMQEWVLIAVIVAMMFFAYIAGTVKPHKVAHQITNRGIKTGGVDYVWSQLGRFWFEEKWGEKILYVESLFSFPGRLMLILEKEQENQVKKILSEYLLMEEPEKTWSDKASGWLSDKIPLERTS